MGADVVSVPLLSVVFFVLVGSATQVARRHAWQGQCPQQYAIAKAFGKCTPLGRQDLGATTHPQRDV